jgi:hypothetical protein
MNLGKNPQFANVEFDAPPPEYVPNALTPDTLWKQYMIKS